MNQNQEQSNLLLLETDQKVKIHNEEDQIQTSHNQIDHNSHETNPAQKMIQNQLINQLKENQLKMKTKN